MNYEIRDFESDVIEASAHRPIMVDFWADWCGPCKLLSPALEKVAAENSHRVGLVIVDTERHQDLARQYEVSNLPNVKLFHKGAVLDEFVGVLSEMEILKWLDRALPTAHVERIETARRYLAEGHIQAATSILEAVVEQEPHPESARLLLAEAVFTEDPSRAVQLLDSLAPDSELAGHANALRIMANIMIQYGKGFPEGPGREPFLAGIAALKQRNYSTAMEAVIEALDIDRHYAADLPATLGKAMVQFLGIRHPVIEQFHRRFSSLIYA